MLYQTKQVALPHGIVRCYPPILILGDGQALVAMVREIMSNKHLLLPYEGCMFLGINGSTFSQNTKDLGFEFPRRISHMGNFIELTK